MSATICPTVTAEDLETYNRQVEVIANFATRIHIDVADGTLTPNKLVDLSQVWWPGGVRADLHVMEKHPFQHIDTYLALGPQMVVIHAEAEGDFTAFANTMHSQGIEVGVAILPDTSASQVLAAADFIDHILIFSGTLGSFGGHVDLRLLEKVKEIRAHTKRIEIGWDGGINSENARLLTDGGIQVLNTGGFIQQAENPEQAFQELQAALGQAEPDGFTS